MFTVSDLPYEYDALEPHFDARTMEIHHQKHHQSYAAKANAALEGTEWADKTTREILTNLDHLPINIRAAAQNNVGGFCNHNFFWAMIAPGGSSKPVGNLSAMIDATFGSLDKLKEEFNAAAAAQFGSGWAWLILDENQALKVISTANQDSPLSLGYTRVLGLDVWEHAYYLHYQNRRPDYIAAFWNVVNWDQAEAWYEAGGI